MAMGFRFTVLASGSSGNCSLLQANGSGVLIDIGLRPPALRERLDEVGLTADGIKGLILTHTHTDHWNDGALGWLRDRQLPLYCHPSHHTYLTRSANFRRLLADGLIRDFQGHQDLDLPGGFRCRPIPVRHDGGATFGFRFDGPADLFGSASALGYATDLGIWDEVLLESFAGVDLLALEFNHDVHLERNSPRPAFLIERVLGDHGHLSNDQAGHFVQELLLRAGPDRLAHVVLLHLSGQCNRPLLARKSAQDALDAHGCLARVHVGKQDAALKPIDVGLSIRRRGGQSGARLESNQPLLPGF